jgi:hypothetical protein
LLSIVQASTSHFTLLSILAKRYPDNYLGFRSREEV